MLKETIIILLLIALIYYYRQSQKKPNLGKFLGEENTKLFELQELKTKLGSKTLDELLEENEDYETEVDTLTRTKNSLEQDLLAQSNAFQNRVREKDREVKKLKEDLSSEKQQLKGSIERIQKFTKQITGLEKDKKELDKLKEQNQTTEQELRKEKESLLVKEQDLVERESELTNWQKKQQEKLNNVKKQLVQIGGLYEKEFTNFNELYKFLKDKMVANKKDLPEVLREISLLFADFEVKDASELLDLLRKRRKELHEKTGQLEDLQKDLAERVEYPLSLARLKKWRKLFIANCDGQDNVEVIKNWSNDKLLFEIERYIATKASLYAADPEDQQDKETQVEKMPGEFPQEQNEAEHQEQLRRINLLFDPNAKDYEKIDFNGLYELLKGVSERERERERESGTDKSDSQSPKKEKK